MQRTLFLVLGFLLCFSQARADIEVYSDGHEYRSFQAYSDFKKSAAEQSYSVPVPLDSQQQDYIRQQAQQLGVKVDFDKVKTLQIHHGPLSDITLHRLYVLSVEHGMVGALEDFYQTWGQSGLRSPYRISSDQLQQVIQQQVTASQAPKLLISRPGKVRIMTVIPDNPGPK